MNTKIYFRADASAAIGYGHFVRSLALADMLRDDFDCTFFTVEPTPYQVAEMESVCHWQSLPEDTALDDFLQLLQGDEIVVLDNYFYTTDYQRKVKTKGCRLVVTNDMRQQHDVADIVINHGLTDASLFDVEPYTRLCLGFDWALLRRPFLEDTEAVERDHITICFGGSDQYDLTGKYIRMVKSSGINTTIVAVVGDGYSPQSPKVDGVDYRSRLLADEMAALFRSSSLVICSASSVCIEAFACGAKVAAGWYVDNQRRFYEALSTNGNIIPLGNLLDHCNMPNFSIATINPVADSTLIAHRYRNLFLSVASGAYLRPARTEDRDLIFRWANDRAVRANSFNTAAIPYEDHCRWYDRMMLSGDNRLYIMVDSGNLIGQARLSIEADEATIGYSVAPEYRGKGYGNKIIRLLALEAQTTPQIKTLIAMVKDGNIASQKVFSHNGFRYSWDERGIKYIKKNSIR